MDHSPHSLFSTRKMNMLKTRQANISTSLEELPLVGRFESSQLRTPVGNKLRDPLRLHSCSDFQSWLQLNCCNVARSNNDNMYEMFERALKRLHTLDASTFICTATATGFSVSLVARWTLRCPDDDLGIVPTSGRTRLVSIAHVHKFNSKKCPWDFLTQNSQ